MYPARIMEVKHMQGLSTKCPKGMVFITSSSLDNYEGIKESLGTYSTLEAMFYALKVYRGLMKRYNMASVPNTVILKCATKEAKNNILTRAKA